MKGTYFAWEIYFFFSYNTFTILYLCFELLHCKQHSFRHGMSGEMNLFSLSCCRCFNYLVCFLATLCTQAEYLFTTLKSISTICDIQFIDLQFSNLLVGTHIITHKEATHANAILNVCFIYQIGIHTQVYYKISAFGCT